MNESVTVCLQSPCCNCTHYRVCRHKDAYETFVKESNEKLQEIVAHHKVLELVTSVRKNYIIWDFCAYKSEH